jgi:choline dehydrogenase-like flavoprotein
MIDQGRRQALEKQTFDYVIVGAGSAGCVLANRLTEDGRHSVLLLESGPPDDHPLIAMPMGIGRLRRPGSPYYHEYQVSKGGNRGDEPWIKGRTLGGSSSINGMVYTRGSPDDYDHWAALGCHGWGWAEIGRCFVRIEDHQLGAAEWRGTGGPLRITLSGEADPLAEAVIAAAAQAGTPTVEDINDIASVTYGGFGRQPRTIARGQRFSAAAAFLRPAMARANLHNWTDAHVSEILFEGMRAVGVRIGQGSDSRTVLARREVILAAGAIESPKLLQLAGIGPASLLRALGIAVKVDAPNVGRNMREHRTISVSYDLRSGGKNRALRGLCLYQSAFRYFLQRRGPLAGATFDVGGFVKTRPGLERPDGQVGVGLFSFEGPGAVSPRPGMTMFGYFLRPQSRGTVSIRSTDPFAAPAIDANYLATQEDREHTVSLMRYMRRIAAQPSLQPFILSEVRPGAGCESDDDLIEASFTYGTSGFHVVGTCRMGADDGSVVDLALKVRGVAGLRVVDTSIMPELISGNTNGPAMAIAWRAADIILEEGRA